MTDDDDRVWVEDRQWRVPSEYDRCRMLRCSNAPVADLRRSAWIGGARVDRWWAYCEEHLYGRRLLIQRIVQIGVHPDSPAAKRGYVG